MTNSLFKTTTIDPVTLQVVVPAVPYRPAVPPRTVYELRTVCKWRYSVPGNYTYVLENGQYVATFVPDPPLAPGATLVGTWGCAQEYAPVYYPGTPEQAYVPAQTIYVDSGQTGYNLGWNAGARSRAFITGNGNAKFKVRKTVVGAIVGLNYYDGIDARYNGNTIDYAFQCQRGLARVVENGVVKTGAFAYTDATEFTIDHTSGTITYKMAGSTVYTSGTAASTTVAAWLEAALYSGDDEVFDPSITQVGAGDTATKNGTIAASLPSMTAFMTSGQLALLAGSLPKMTALMTAGLSAPAFAVGSFYLPQMSFNGTSLTGEKGAMAGSLKSLDALMADHPYGEIFASLPSVSGVFYAYEGNYNASMSASALGSSSMAPTTFLVVTMNSTATAASTMTTTAVVPADLFSQAALGSTLAVDSILEAVMLSVATSGSTLGVPEAEAETWVVNLDSSASTSYTNYAFNSYAQIGNKFYGANSAGLFELTGDTDAGVPIRASISLGKQDAGNALKKTWQQCYVGMSAKGNLFIKVIAEGQEYIYKTRDWNEELQQQRVTFGKGLRTNYVTLEIYNEDGADFEIDTVQFIVADLSRKI